MTVETTMPGSPAEDKPAWWEANERLRAELELAAYEPPRFADGTYTHDVVDELESRHGCSIMFRSAVNPDYPEDWEVRVDGRSVARIGRHRDRNGNTVYECDPAAFVRTIEESIESGHGSSGRDR